MQAARTRRREAQLDRLFQALSDPTRRAILRQAATGEHTVSALAEPHRLTYAAVSKHLRVLEAADLINRRKVGSFQMISLNPETLKSADQWLNFYRQFWTARLGSLKNFLEEKKS